MSDWTIAPTGTSPAVPAAPHVDYLLEWVGKSSYLSGERVPLRWQLRRRDGAVVEIPTSTEVVLVSPAAVTSTLPVDIDSLSDAIAHILAALWTVPGTPGLWSAQLNLTVGADNQVRSQKMTFTVV